MSLEGKVAVVTGASQGIGSALALDLARRGAAVVCAARSAAGLSQVVDAITAAGGKALAVPTDVGDNAAVAAMIERTMDAFGRLDMLVNNAALVGNKTSLDTPLEDFEREFRVNLFGALAGITAALPHLKVRGGHILNVSSMIALNTMAGMMAYGTSKIAIERLTMDVAEQLEGTGVACNALRIDVGVFPGGKPRAREGIDAEAAKVIAVMARYGEPLETGAAAMAWMLEQDPAAYTGVIESLRDMIARGSVQGTAEELMPLTMAKRWTW